MHQPNVLTISRTTGVDGAQVLHVGGELDMASAPELADALTATILSGGVSDIMIDLAALTFLDAAGLTAFARAHHLARHSGRVLRARNARGEVDTVLRITDVAELLQMDDIGASIEALDSTATQKMIT